jgi:hypothetical protein
MKPLAIGIALGDDGAGVVEQHLLGHTAEVLERADQPAREGGEVLAPGELHEARSRVTQRGHQRQQRVGAAANDGEVSLHLLPRRGLEAHDRFRLHPLHRRQPRLELRQPAFVAALLELTQQHRCGNPVRRAASMRSST